MSKIFLAVHLLVVLYALTLILSLYTDKFLFLEVIAALLPYWIAVNMFLIVVYVVLIFLKPNPQIIFYVLPLLFLVLSTLVLFKFLLGFSFASSLSGTGNKEVKIAFFNKLYSNTNYQEINDKLTALNADFLGIAEMTVADRTNLPSLSSYPCSLGKNVRDNASLYFFSKYPCSTGDPAYKSPYVLPVKVSVGQQQYHVFLIHPMPPINSGWRYERDRELDYLSDYIRSLKDENVIVLGDFNLSPWSKSFRRLSGEWEGLKNAALGKGLAFTWHNRLVQAQIDHIFIPANFSINSFTTEKVSGSDHNLIWTKVQI